MRIGSYAPLNKVEDRQLPRRQFHAPANIVLIVSRRFCWRQLAPTQLARLTQNRQDPVAAGLCRFLRGIENQDRGVHTDIRCNARS
jgi:hypothetical protein